MQTILITGGTGLVGKHLTKHLIERGYQVIVLTRKIPKKQPPDPAVEYALWNIKKQTVDLKAIQKANFIVHLAGAGVMDKRWTHSYKAEIVKSRTQSSALLIDALQNNIHSVKAVVSASAIGWYGEDPPPRENGFIETDEDAAGFLGDTCRKWEQSIEAVEKLSIRLVKIRIGIILSNEGGAFPEFKMPVKFGVAGILGSGRQVISWIHIDDLCRAFSEAIENEQMKGSYNAVAPLPVTNKELTIELANQLKGKFYIPIHVPEFVLKIILGERCREVLKSATVSCEKIKQTGFTFLYPGIISALQQLCHNDR